MKQIIVLFLFSFSIGQSIAQDTLRLTLDEAVALARNQSPQAVAARHQYRASYWNWRSHKANYLPSVTLNTYSTLNRSISSVTLPDGSDSFVHRNQLLNDGAITINQNIPLLGGSIYMRTGLQRLDLFTDNTLSYKSTPVVIGYSQNLLGYNYLKWNKEIEPIRYSQAQKAYTETQELVAATAAMKFHQLALAQNSWQSAAYNYAAADTLYQYAKGRYEIGTITENEMLQLEINYLSEQTNMMNARIEMDDMILDLRSFLGITNNIEIEVQVSDNIPNFMVPVEEAVYYAHENSPDIEYYTLRELESESAVARAKASRGLKADLYAEFGLSQTNSNFRDSYRNPLDQQLVSLGIRIPILDWGVGKGQIEVARSNLEKVKIDMEQARTDFEANVIKMVKQFNLQADKVAIAYKTADRAVRRNNVAYRLYLLGKSSVLDLNSAVEEKDRSQQAYIRELQNYWSLYYGIRSITGYDFETGRQLLTEYDNFN
ncbi:MAG: TolC family protein [Fermentimonas sp.]|jgi:outer membrane protein TolC|nr:TolC family protein [Fermentimonas sp.]MDD2931245.1 TolC family protein [Fermentimonas sp.]